MTTTPLAQERRIPAQRHAAAHVAQYIHELSARHARDRRAAERGARRGVTVPAPRGAALRLA